MRGVELIKPDDRNATLGEAPQRHAADHTETDHCDVSVHGG